jgi:hypothetical protein
MGKTGTTKWVQVKGVKGQIRLVPQKEGDYKKPGPNQRFKSGSTLKKVMASEAEDQGRGRRRGGRGGRGGASQVDKRVRRRMKRSRKSVMGLKTK